jgi:hypothetical protein
LDFAADLTAGKENDASASVVNFLEYCSQRSYPPPRLSAPPFKNTTFQNRSPAHALPAFGPVIESVLVDFPAESIAVDAQGLGRLGLVTVVFLQNFLDEPFLEFSDSDIKGDAMFDQLVDEGFELLFHDRTPWVKD